MPVSAKTQLDRQYHEMRWRILSLAADLDRIQRYEDGPAVMADPRLEKLRECITELLSLEGGRAERVQRTLSDPV